MSSRVCPACRALFPAGANFCPHDGQKLTDVADDEDAGYDPFIGAMLDDRYRIETRLGQGGMGVVYAARHIVIDKPVAIKVLRDEYCRDPGMVERFMREARAVSRIGHPHIVDVTDFGRLEDGHIYFVMEFLSGTTLSRELRDHEYFPTWRVIDVAIQICSGLEGAHDKGIVHRDLKPENVFIINPTNERAPAGEVVPVRQNFVKLLDFGVAKISWGQGARLTKAGSIFGTPQYMSPEQAAGEDGDHRGDIYAHGCMIYEMVTGEVPFLGETFMGTLTKHMFEEPVAPRAQRPELSIPEDLEAVILRSLAKDPKDRFQSMGEMVIALTECQNRIQRAQRPKAQTMTRAAAERMVPPIGDARMAVPPTEDVRVVPPTDDVRMRVPGRGDRSSLPLVAGIFALMILGGVGLLLHSRGKLGGGGTDAPDASTVAASDAAASPADAAPGERIADARGLTSGVWVLSTPPGADVLVEGSVVGKTPFRIDVPRGEAVIIELRRRGFKDVRRQIIGRENVRPLTVRLKRKSRRPSLRDLRDPYNGGKGRRR